MYIYSFIGIRTLLYVTRGAGTRQGYGGSVGHQMPMRGGGGVPAGARSQSLDAPHLAQPPRLDVDFKTLLHDDVLVARPSC